MHISSLWFAIRIWFIMEWNMWKRGFTPEQKAQCWMLHGQHMDAIRYELQQMIEERGAVKSERP